MESRLIAMGTGSKGSVVQSNVGMLPYREVCRGEEATGDEESGRDREGEGGGKEVKGGLMRDREMARGSGQRGEEEGPTTQPLEEAREAGGEEALEGSEREAGWWAKLRSLLNRQQVSGACGQAGREG